MKQRTYKELKPRHRYQSSDFWFTLTKKGYHPKTGTHKPTISVVDHNEYLLEAQLNSGKFELDGWSYPVIEWSFISRTRDDIYDSTHCVYQLILGTDGIPVPKYTYRKPDDEHDYGVGGTRVKSNYRVSGVLVTLLKKRALVDDSHHEVVVSVNDYHDYLFKHNAQSGVIEFNHMLYLIKEFTEIPRKAALKKDGTPYYSRTKHYKLLLRVPGRKIFGYLDQRYSKLDEMLNDVQI